MRTVIKDARDRLESLRLALLSPSPEDIHAALPGLAEAVQCLETLKQEIGAGHGERHEFREELARLKNDLKLTLRLIEQGRAFGQLWARMLGVGPSYTQAGIAAPAPIAETGALSLRG